MTRRQYWKWIAVAVILAGTEVLIKDFNPHPHGAVVLLCIVLLLAVFFVVIGATMGRCMVIGHAWAFLLLAPFGPIIIGVIPDPKEKTCPSGSIT